MSVRTWFKRLFSGEREDKEERHDFSDEDRERSSISRKMNKIKKAELDMMLAEIEDLKMIAEEKRVRRRLEEIKNDLYGEEEDESDYEEGEDELKSEETLFMRLASKVLDKMDDKPAVSQKTTLTNAEIESYYAKLNAIERKVVAEWSDAQIATQVKKQLPALTDESMSRIIAYVRSQ